MPKETEQITDEDLDRAAEAPDTSESDLKVDDGTPAEDDTPAEPAGEEEVVEEEVVEEVVEEEIPDEPEDNRERSELGRKVKEQGEQMASFMDTVTDAIEEIRTSVKPKAEEEELDDDYPLTMTAKEYKALIKEEIAKAGVLTKGEVEAQKRQSKEYENGYMKKFDSLTADMPKEEKAEIKKEFLDNKDINVKHSDNPLIDAQLNFFRAQTNVLRKQVAAKAKPVNPLDKNKDNPDQPLGGPLGTNNQEVKGAKVIKLDPEAAKFAKASGMSDEEVQETLSGDMPAYLGG